MNECVDGEYQNYTSKGGAYTRKHFFGKYPELREMVSAMSDDDIWRLNRGGHDPHKVYAAYAAATSHKGQPSIILAKTVKGYGMGAAGEGQNITHQQKTNKALERLKKEAALLGANGIVIQNISTNTKQHFNLNKNDKGEILASSRHEKQKELSGIAIFVK